VDQTALQNLAQSPALTGAIPIAIFDTAMKEFKNNAIFAEEFFTMFFDFDSTTVACLRKILNHVLDNLRDTSPNTVSTAMCEFRAPFIGVERTSPAFASALGQALDSLNISLAQIPEGQQFLLRHAVQWTFPLSESEEITDPGIKKVLKSSIKKWSRLMGPEAWGEVSSTLQKGGKAEETVVAV
jgi:U3 small nucleolar RNA-associated protein 6